MRTHHFSFRLTFSVLIMPRKYSGIIFLASAETRFPDLRVIRFSKDVSEIFSFAVQSDELVDLNISF